MGNSMYPLCFPSVPNVNFSIVKSAQGRVAQRNPTECGRGALRPTSKVCSPDFPDCALRPTEPCHVLDGARQPHKQRKAPAPHRALPRPVRHAATTQTKESPGAHRALPRPVRHTATTQDKESRDTRQGKPCRGAAIKRKEAAYLQSLLRSSAFVEAGNAEWGLCGLAHACAL
ncbi:hypothetical protein NDU88_010932 [Pleurodeles waltl]|uniref:Uncharacterized protein n=1 Tax=Pleurodeles waltl TaxID=8319 RepID=A0AAV7R1Z4_PLEWA|nr:hypothetical protein NDU88_010932 [Pleurodeles waltl]